MLTLWKYISFGKKSNKISFSNLRALKTPVDRHPIGRDQERTPETQNISFSVLRTTTVY